MDHRDGPQQERGGNTEPVIDLNRPMSKEFATYVVRKLTEAGYTAYWAGGCVRDLLRGVEPHDYDVATNATPEQVRAVFGPGRSKAVGESFGVVIVLGKRGSGDAVEVATFRRDAEYLDGRRPSRVEFCSAEEDARRRDFTVNGMFFDPLKEKVLDYVGGEADLTNRLIRAIGSPHERMKEDKLRVLRAVRFTSILDYNLDPETAEAIRSLAGDIVQVSAERIAQELRKILSHPSRARAMELCVDLHLMEFLFPEVVERTIQEDPTRWPARLALMQRLGETRFPVGLAALLRDLPVDQLKMSRQTPKGGTVGGVAQRLRLSNEEAFQTSWLVAHQGRIQSLPHQPMSVVKPFVAHPLFKELLHIERTAAMVSGESDSPFRWAEEFLQTTPMDKLNPPQLISGDDLIQMGIPASSKFKIWLQTIRDAQLNEEISTRDEALSLIQKWRTE